MKPQGGQGPQWTPNPPSSPIGATAKRNDGMVRLALGREMMTTKAGREAGVRYCRDGLRASPVRG
jgi:hypothetical protein